MKILPTLNGAQIANTRSGSFSRERSQSSFGNILIQQGTSKKYSYDASSGGRTHSFSEMPIVAPAAIGSPESPKASGKETVEVHGIKAEDRNLQESPTSRFAVPEAKFSIAEFTTMIAAKGRADLLRQTVNHAKLVYPSATFLQKNQASLRNAQVLPVHTPSLGGTVIAARQMPFHVQLSQAASGVRILITANSLSDNEQLELEGNASELARRYGLAVSEVRVGKFGRRN
ncbi:MAG: hypothetical protein WA793_03670 [Sphingorhabdus sp.]|uniref:hypothetical protein n=1 Tax=Sphingorhabdus sp. TaxID=1902408 RepID=UPI003CA48074